MKNIILSLLFLWLCHGTTLAQTACFTIDNPRGCVPHTINVTDCSTGANNGIFYDYNFTNGTSFVPATNHTYNSAGTFTVRQLVTAGVPGSNDAYASLTVTVINPTKPVIKVDLCENFSVTVTATDNAYDNYDVNFGDGTVLNTTSNVPVTHVYASAATQTIIVKGKFTSGNSCTAQETLYPVTPILAVTKPDVTFLETTSSNSSTGTLAVHFNALPYLMYDMNIKSISGSYSTNATLQNNNGASIYTFTNLNTVSNHYTIQVKAKDACAHALLSDEITSTNLAVTAQNNNNALTWSDYNSMGSNFNNYEIIKNNVPLTSQTTNSYNDNQIVCANQYCYQIKSLLTTSSSSGAQYSLSFPQCVTAISTNTPTAVQNLNSSIQNNQVSLVFDTPSNLNDIVKFSIKESKSGGAFQEVASGLTNTYTLNSSSGNCYQVSYTDKCQNTSTISNTTCTVKLQAEINANDQVVLNWSAYSGYVASGIKGYEVYVYNSDNQLIKTLGFQTSLSALDKPSEQGGILNYVVKVIANGNENIISYSNYAAVSFEPTLYVPEVFSPNNDGINDEIVLTGKYIASIEIVIYNRWGEPVHQSNDMQRAWDGLINGSEAPIGNYAYTITFQGNKGDQKKQKGIIALIR